MFTTPLAVIGPFEAIQYVGTPLTLLAFVVAVAAWVYRSRLAERRKLIETAPSEERGKLMIAAIRDFSTVPLENLTREQRFQLALKLIDERQARFRVTAVVALVVAVAFAVVILVVDDSPARTGLVVRLHGPGGPGDVIRRGSVILDAGDLRLTAEIGPDGQARFENIDETAFSHGVTIVTRVPGLEPVAATTLDAPPPGGAVYIAMQPGATEVRGTVLADTADRRPLAGVVVNFDSGAAVDTTDTLGNFHLVVARPPGSRVPVLLVRDGQVGLDDAVTVARDHPLVLHFRLDGGP